MQVPPPARSLKGAGSWEAWSLGGWWLVAEKQPEIPGALSSVFEDFKRALAQNEVVALRLTSNPTSDNPLQLSAGLILGTFQALLTETYGWPLTASEQPSNTAPWNLLAELRLTE
ncbi:hypothetical protein NDU88_001674 [Pleurodeles waltl]|uniref:Uncharacterized protein n=1 Tax=Pleurodeles waltl TaxID=8319 RepID=A0AAV7ML63_PLEWA|nr:hypothetical protein NDU88_001674 [Pleurodeles waltl]